MQFEPKDFLKSYPIGMISPSLQECREIIQKEANVKLKECLTEKLVKLKKLRNDENTPSVLIYMVIGEMGLCERWLEELSETTEETC